MGKLALSATITYVENFLTGSKTPKEYVDDAFKNRDAAFRKRLLEIFTELNESRNDGTKKADVITKLCAALSE